MPIERQALIPRAFELRIRQENSKTDELDDDQRGLEPLSENRIFDNKLVSPSE